MKKSFTAVTIILALIAVVEAGILIFSFVSLNQQSRQKVSLQQELTELKQQKQDLEASQGEAQFNLGKVSQERDSLLEQIKSLQDDNSNLNKDLDKEVEEKGTLSAQLKDSKDEASNLRSDVSSLNQKFMCEDTLTDVDFTSLDLVNKALGKYVEDTKNMTEPVSARYYNQIWTGQKYSIHTVEVHTEKDRMTYLWKFTVYFRGENFGLHENGIFYNDQQCWLYLDK